MTIKEFCEIYKCDISAIYQKMKRNEEKLKGHIDKSDGKAELDEYAVEFLMPERIKAEKQHNEEAESLKVKIREMDIKYGALRYDYDELMEKYEENEYKIKEYAEKEEV